MVLMYTWVHGLAFCVIGGVASRSCLATCWRQPPWAPISGNGILISEDKTLAET